MTRMILALIVLTPLCAPDNAEARSRRGTLTLKSKTKGALVFVNGRRVGKIPLKKPIRLHPGTHTVRVSKIGFADFLENVRIRRGRRATLEADLIELNGILRIESKPTHADVVIDGRLFGRTPFREALEPGRYSVIVRAKNRLDFQRNVALEAGQVFELNPVLVYQAPLASSKPWYRNKWIWIGAAGVVLTTTIITAVSLTSGEKREAAYPKVVVETIR